MSWFNFSRHDFALAFLSVLFEGIPFLLLGSLISGLVDVFVSSDRLSRMLPKNKLAAVLLSGLLGLVFPMCECGSVIVIRRFIRKGLPISCAVTYMLGAPIVSPVVALSTYAAFSVRLPQIEVSRLEALPFFQMVGGYLSGQKLAVEMTTLRLGLGYAIAVLAGLLLARFDTSRILQPGMIADAPNKRSGFRFAAAPTAPNDLARDFADVVGTASFPRKLLLAVQSATADFLDVAFFFIIGCGITSVFNTAVNQGIIQSFATLPLPAILTLMVLAAALALCSTTDAFVAASFTAFPFTAKLAFLVFGPVLDLKLFWLYGLIFKRKVVVALSLGLFVVIAFCCWQLSGWW